MKNAKKKKTKRRPVRKNSLSFFDTVKSGPDLPYIILLLCYVISEYVERINWSNPIISSNAPNFFDYLALLGSAAYLCYKAAMWKTLRSKPLILVPCILAAGCLCGYFLLFLSQDWKHHKVIFTVVMDFFLCLMAYGKDYKKLLRYLVFVPVAILLIAGLGLPAGLTENFSKMGQTGTTCSLGIIYPNTWGYIAFQVMLLVWYLYLKKKPLLTFAMFWAMGVFMYFVIGCRTIAVLSLALPPFTLLISWKERRDQDPEKLLRKKPGVFAWFAIALPVLCCVLSIVLSMEKEWLAVNFYPTAEHPNAPLHSMTMRFVQGGLALDYFGFPLFGRQMRITAPLYLDSSTGVEEYLYVMDNAYTSFIIMKGVLWMICILAWVTFAHWRGWKKRDYSILLISCFMVVFALMERPGLEVWYNFVLLYPLASFAAEQAPEKKQFISAQSVS